MVGLIKKVLGGEKKDFYLELDENKDTAAAEKAQQPEPEAVEAPVEEKAEAPASETTPAPEKPEVQAETPAPKPQPVDSDAIVAAAVNGKQTSQSESASSTTFATDFLMSVPTKARRRPGPSLKMFQDMARQMNVPRG